MSDVIISNQMTSAEGWVSARHSFNRLSLYTHLYFKPIKTRQKTIYEGPGIRHRGSGYKRNNSIRLYWWDYYCVAELRKRRVPSKQTITTLKAFELSSEQGREIKRKSILSPYVIVKTYGVSQWGCNFLLWWNPSSTRLCKASGGPSLAYCAALLIQRSHWHQTISQA